MSNHNCLAEVVTAAEAARLWEKHISTIKKRCQEGRFREDEYRHAGKEWLILKSALIREYGEVPSEAVDEGNNHRRD